MNRKVKQFFYDESKNCFYVHKTNFPGFGEYNERQLHTTLS